MQVKVKLFAGLQDYLPADAGANSTTLDIDTNTTVYQVIDKFQVPRHEAHLILLNGIFVEPGARDRAGLFREGDTLAVWPPVAGG
jgi:molybdopterin converting factor small subunit